MLSTSISVVLGIWLVGSLGWVGDLLCRTVGADNVVLAT